MPKYEGDPGLQEAAEKIKAILKEYDCAAVITLASGNGHSEYVNFITDPTWSALTLEKNEKGFGIRFRAMAKSAPAEERLRERVKMNRTVNMVWHFQDVLLMQWGMFEKLKEIISKEVNVEEEVFKHQPTGPDS